MAALQTRSFVIDLEEIYGWLSRQSAPEQLAVRFREAEQRDELDARGSREPRARPVGTAIPAPATLNVAIDALDLLPKGNATSASEDRVIKRPARHRGEERHRCAALHLPRARARRRGPRLQRRRVASNHL